MDSGPGRQSLTPAVCVLAGGTLAAGATVEEIMEVLKLCVAQGVQSCNMGVPILAEELERARLTQR